MGRDQDGRATFVDDALPGETVMVELTEERARFARGQLFEVIDRSPARIEPRCPFVAAGCGGCDLQHAKPLLQLEMKERMVRDALERIGKLHAPPMDTYDLPPGGHRTTVRAGVVDGRAGFRRRRSHDLVIPDSCVASHPLAEELLVDGRYDGCESVTIRVGARTGERMVIVKGPTAGVRVADDVLVIDDAASRKGHAAIHEDVAGFRFRVSARSFFQTRPDGADALVELVAQAIESRFDAPPEHLVDLYAGVGLFSATLSRGNLAAVQVTAVERAKSSVGDARHNLRAGTKVLPIDVERWQATPADVIVADPAREGVGAKVVGQIAASGARLVALVSCDAGSLGRDAAALVAAGYALTTVTLVDMFPDTHHVEVVSIFDRR